MDMEERQRTNADVLKRIHEIDSSLRRLAGVLMGLNERRLKSNTIYWINTMQGWANHLSNLANDLALMRATLARELTE